MTMPVPLVVHEQRGVWGRQLRARMSGQPVRVLETRLRAEFAENASRSACPILVVVLDDRPDQVLEDMVRALLVAPGALALVIDPRPHPLLSWTARELGATHVIPGATPPPAVAELLGRWAILARRRADADGWWPTPPPETVDSMALVGHFGDPPPPPFRLCLTGSAPSAPETLSP
jgi:hypothetical protein